MPITIPKPTNLIPKLVKAKVPVWLVAAIVAADVVAVQLAQPKEPICTLKVDYPHHSTSVKKYSGVDAIKVNIVSKCDVDQSYTLVDATILEKLVAKFLTTIFYKLERTPIQINGQRRSLRIFGRLANSEVKSSMQEKHAEKCI